MSIKRQVAWIRAYMMLLSIEATIFISTALDIFCHMPQRGIALGIMAGILVVTIGIGSSKTKKLDSEALELTEKERQWLKKLSGIYKRKMLISFIICFALMALAVGNSYCLPAGIFLVCNNGGKQYLLERLEEGKGTSLFHRYVKKMIWLSLLYWGGIALILLICFLLGIGMSGLNNLLVLAAILFLIVFCLYFLSVQKEYSEIVSKISPYKKGFVGILCLAILLSFLMGMKSWWLLPYIQTVEKVGNPSGKIIYDQDAGSYSITMSEDSFRILQLTDIHLTGSLLCGRKDVKALNAAYRLIEHARPDLVIITGDLVYPMGLFTFSVNNYSPIEEFAKFMERIQIPWAFVYGNHDTEAVATHTAEQINQLLSKYSYASFEKMCLYNSCQPSITGRSNQVIRILNQDGTVNQALFLLDSNSYLTKGGGHYDYIHDDQVTWYEENIMKLQKEQGQMVSSLLFFHIPLKEYEKAYEEYRKGNPEVTYYFGTMGETDGKVSASKQESRLFEAVTRLQSTKAIFVGHDHYNNMCLGYQGVKLTYGMSIDYVAIPGIARDTAQRGGTLITLHKGSAVDIRQIPLSSLTE